MAGETKPRRMKVHTCKYCGQAYDRDNYLGGYCSRKCIDDEVRAKQEREAYNKEQNAERRQREEERDEEKRQARAIKEAKEEEIRKTTSQSAKRSFKLAIPGFLVTVILAGTLGTKAWWVIVLPLFIIYLGHKGRKEIRQSNGVLKGNLAAVIGLFIGYLTLLGALAQIFSK